MSRGPSTYTDKEANNHPQGRSGSKVPIRSGIIGRPHQNPTTGGGINRATKGKS